VLQAHVANRQSVLEQIEAVGPASPGGRPPRKSTPGYADPHLPLPAFDDALLKAFPEIAVRPRDLNG
jgi:hypothetical protein